MAVDYVHLHVHSDFSLLDGAASVKALAAKAEKLGQTAARGAAQFGHDHLREGPALLGDEDGGRAAGVDGDGALRDEQRVEHRLGQVEGDQHVAAPDPLSGDLAAARPQDHARLDRRAHV